MLNNVKTSFVHVIFDIVGRSIGRFVSLVSTQFSSFGNIYVDFCHPISSIFGEHFTVEMCNIIGVNQQVHFVKLHQMLLWNGIKQKASKVTRSKLCEPKFKSFVIINRYANGVYTLAF